MGHATSRRLRGASAVLALVASGAAMAADAAPPAVGLLTPVRYADEATAKQTVREQCELEKILQDDLLAALRAHGRQVDPVATTDTGSVLDVRIQRVEAPPSHWTGPKMMSVTVRAYQDGKSQHVKMLTAWGHGGVNIFASNCGILQSDASDLAEQVARWLDELDRTGGARAEPAAAASTSAR
jgi:hypothetical protein